jgi:hypothetical protein
MKILFLIIASRNEVHEADRISQVSTWAAQNSENVSILWLRGWDKDYFSLVGRELYVPCSEKYENILEKTVLGIKYVLEHINFDILIRSNVSTYFDLSLLGKELARDQFSGDFYGGYVDKTKGGYFGGLVPYEYLSGTGIFLSKSCAQLLSKLKPKDFTCIPDDVAISEFCRIHGLRRIRMKRNNLHSTHIFWPSFHIRTKSSTDSYLAGKRMVLINEYFTAKTALDRMRIYASIQFRELIALINHPESIRFYLMKNWVVFSSYVQMRLERLFQ